MISASVWNDLAWGNVMLYLCSIVPVKLVFPNWANSSFGEKNFLREKVHIPPPQQHCRTRYEFSLSHTADVYKQTMYPQLFQHLL